MTKNTLSVIMPALNEENNIEPAVLSTLVAFNKLDIDGEIIVINDGSTDNTETIVAKIASIHNRVRLINHPTSQGIGSSFWDGMKNSTMDVIVMFPGDNENDAENALSFFNFMDEVDIIVPFIHNTEIRTGNRILLSKLYRFIVNSTFGINLNYTNGTVFYRRCLFEGLNLNTHGFFYQAEILIKLIKKGYLYTEVPNFLNIRNNGKSKAIKLKSLLAVINGYLGLLREVYFNGCKEDKNYKNLNPQSVAYAQYLRINQAGSER